MSSKKKYTFSYGVEKKIENSNHNIIENINIKEILITKVDLLEENILIYDYDSQLTIKGLKEYFLLTFGHKYKCCPCVLFIYYKDKKYILLDEKESIKLSNNNHSHLYIIRRDTMCDCQLKEYNYYINMNKFDIIAELTTLKKLYRDLTQENQKLISENISNEGKIKELTEKNNLITKKDEINKKRIFEEFYDVIIDIKSIKNIKKGWNIKMNDKGKEKYLKHKNENLLRIGVTGHNNKGKSFILSKISNINLLSGVSIQTNGLSIKYPDKIGHSKRNLILLDSAGLETPVLKTIKNNVI